MSKVTPRKLKVYQAQFGFYDSVVAAPNQGDALKAWGTHQNLFAQGDAWIADDAHATTAALAHPGVPLRRAVGSTDPFSLVPGIPKFPDLPRAAKKPTAKEPKPKSKPTPPDRTALDAAEAMIQKLEADQRREATELKERRASLDAEEDAARRRWKAERAKAEGVLDRERQAFDRAGRQDA